MIEATSYDKGILAEIYVALFLVLKGYKILAWRYKTRVGEVDLIARKRDTIVFVEVKQRPSLEKALEATTPRMRRRIAAASRHFLSRHIPSSPSFTARFDLAAIAGFRIRHLDNAWEEHT